MKKYILYIVLIAVGVLLGWLLFKSTSSQADSHVHEASQNKAQIWTCSMHPQIQQPEPGDCPICGMDLIPLESESSVANNEFTMTENAIALANIQTTIIGNAAATENNLKLSGKIVENEENKVIQASYFSGRIEKLYINYEGEFVTKGSLLATIYSPELVAAQQELLTALTIKDQQPDLYNAVKNKLKLWKLSDKQIETIEQNKKVTEYFPIYATVSGTVIEKLISEGDYVKQGQPLFKIANLNNVWAVFDAYENQIPHLKTGQKIIIKTQAFPDKSIEATINFIEPIVNTKTRTVKVRTVLDNKTNTLKPGMFVEGYLQILPETNKADKLTIPASAVLWTGERSIVYIKTNSNPPTFKATEVLLGSKLGDYYEVIKGVNSGDEIVTNGTFTVDAAAQLQGKNSMMNNINSGHEHLTNTQTSTQNNSDKKYQVSSTFKEHINKLLSEYILITNALVKSDAKKAQQGAKKLSEALTKLNQVSLKDADAKQNWISVSKKLKTLLENIVKTPDLNKQRMHYKPLSELLNTVIKQYGTTQKVYLQYCPMAHNNTGGYWLSFEEKIANPYFGDAMLTCGEVKQVYN